MKVDISSGLLATARQSPSPHCDDRPPGATLDLIVVHGISLPPGQFGGPWIDALFHGTLPADADPYFADIVGMRVSAHIMIRRSGEIVQYVPFHRRAWHAGVSCYQGRERCNDYSVGIELEGADNVAYTEPQYRRLTIVCRALRQAYPSLGSAPIVGHCHIAPGRKTDPGPAFDWVHFERLMTGSGRSMV
ncbi:MAG: 1,6-anhydro-N-acetylmuramyl-L-alanine amidase AmpD [Pseudomonadota bacterium]|nr:1,6-anhydro-N-acetylmuramyl-L-alanine amidase AmpD [Pseudomonadota bacterium]